MGTKQVGQNQEQLFYASERTETPFYEQLNRVLKQAGFDAFCEERCRGFYHWKLGRPSLAMLHELFDHTGMGSIAPAIVRRSFPAFAPAVRTS